MTREPEPFQKMLLWAMFLHVVVFFALLIAATLGGSAAATATPVLAWMVPGSPGAISSSGGGGTPAPAPAPEPTPPPEEKPSRVVRPTKEDRDQLPLPDAKPAKQPEKKPSSGLRGPDAASAPSAQLKTEGAGGLGLGGIGGGSPFDSDFEYDYYVHQMLTKIRQNWQRVPVRGTAIVIVKFTIFRDGHLENVEVEQSCGVSVLDRSAERAVYLADPMPPLPNSYPRDRVPVHLRFEYSDKY